VTLLLVSLVVFSSTPFTPSFFSLSTPLPPGSCPLPPLTLWAYYSIIYLFSLYLLISDWPVCALSCALPCLCLRSALAPCRWFLLQGRMGVAFIERRLSLVILFAIFYIQCGCILVFMYNVVVFYNLILRIDVALILFDILKLKFVCNLFSSKYISQSVLV
jgi:hypothetical protein